MNDHDEAAIGDGYTDDEEPGAWAAYEADRDAGEAAQGAGPWASAGTDVEMPPLIVWPGHEDCDPRGRVHDDVEGWVCSCGAILGELPDTEEVRKAVAIESSLPATDVAGRDPIITSMAEVNPDQITPDQIERQLANIMARLELGSHYQRDLEVRAFRARADLDIAMAQTITRIVEGDGTKGDAAYRKNKAITDNEVQYRATIEAEAEVRCVRETMHNLRSLQTGFQSLARSVAASMGNPMQGVGGYGR